MNKALWVMMLVVGIGIAIPFKQILAQDKAEADKAAPAAAAAPEAKAEGGAEGALEISPDAAAKAGKGGHSSSQVNFWEILTRAGWFGALIWLGLITCSIISVALIVDSYLTIREKTISPKTLVDAVRGAMEEGDILKAVECCDRSPGPLASILKAGFANVEEGFEVIQDAVSVAADIESEKLLSRVSWLSVISNTTPMLGLIGTVQGMIMAFFNLGTQAAGAAQQAMLAVNISHGLWATAVGLGTAVPATIYFFYFKNKANKIILEMEALTLDVIKSLRNVEVVEG